MVLLGLGLPLQAAAKDLAICAKAKGHPKHYLDEAGQPKGYAVDIAAEAVRRAGYDPKVYNVPWKRAQRMALDGKCVITAFSVTEPRKKHYLFSDAMFIDPVLLWQSVHRRFRFQRFEDLVGMHIGIPAASHYSGDFERVRPKIKLYEDMDKQASLKMLIKGRLDGAIFPGGAATVKYLANQQGLDISKVTASEKPISEDPNHIGVPKSLAGFSPETVLDQLNDSLAGMKADGTIEALLDRYR